MEFISYCKTFINNIHFLPLELVGFITIVGFYLGRLISKVKLPSILGYMVLGVVIGPSLFDFLDHHVQDKLSFITEMSLGFVALSIGIELKFSALKKLGIGIVSIIFAESFGAFLFVFAGLYFFTHNIPLSLIFAAIAPASAPAGTVAVIHEYKAKGSLTKALYAVVGFDDGLGIIIFGFAASIAKNMLLNEGGTETSSLLSLMVIPLGEVFLSFVVGIIIAYIYTFLIRRVKVSTQIFILTFGFVILITGISKHLHLSYILTNMVAGFIIVNTQESSLVHKIEQELRAVIPLLFILFFTLAGANLHIRALPALGLLGIIYIFTRSFGLILGSRLGAMIGSVEDKIKNYVGLGILSQAGVAIGLSLIVKNEFAGIGKVISEQGALIVTTGDKLGATVITTVTASCIFFEIIGPVLTKYALKKAGEIKEDS